MTRTSLLALAAVALAASAFAGSADARSARAQGQYFDPTYEAPPLTVNKRPFTDSGTQVPVGYENDYMVEQTTLHRPVYSTFRPDAFGQDVLPHRFDGLGLPTD
jgi:hypothetical protein